MDCPDELRKAINVLIGRIGSANHEMNAYLTERKKGNSDLIALKRLKKQIKSIVETCIAPESRVEYNAVDFICDNELPPEQDILTTRPIKHGCMPDYTTALNIFTFLLMHQSLAGGTEMVDALNKTVLLCEKLNRKTCCVVEHYVDKQHDQAVNTCLHVIDTYALYACNLYLQVGDKARASEVFLQRPHTTRQERVTQAEAAVHITMREAEQIQGGERACIRCGLFEYNCAPCKHKKCGGCGNALYCSKSCQLKHWEQHKIYCKKVSNAQKRDKPGKMDA
mmetsp:Transcript_19836/g.29481  ORF Transcript_19836/g.29481 Transcript_19836/m.29481 type:complete len:280 (-) Transcript_19836:89-928(-)|eukprot:CAMPEP_0116020110 /NCGR_PEP_ID=MMETSP0321-20121206/9614_1 /TAXON_ID=163516 /ORGANISM="Leptocylindrus danicus var. danicus, Strain B650" /LENGTH=279 /DNA_ID=CAMNT_0003490763 /DNA_START=31 /DNA_END=870 /DNA_ORIENTATION=+